MQGATATCRYRAALRHVQYLSGCQVCHCAGTSEIMEIVKPSRGSMHLLFHGNASGTTIGSAKLAGHVLVRCRDRNVRFVIIAAPYETTPGLTAAQGFVFRSVLLSEVEQIEACLDVASPPLELALHANDGSLHNTIYVLFLLSHYHFLD